MEHPFDEFVQVNVGGLTYSIAVSDIEKFPDSFLQCMIKKEWRKLDGEPIVIHRDGKLFRYVYSFLVSGQLPRNKYGELAIDRGTLEALRLEADYFGLTDLSKECGVQLKTPSILNVDSFLLLKDYARATQIKSYNYKPVTDYEYAGEIDSELFTALKEVWTPFCITGKLSLSFYDQSFPTNNKIYKSSSFRQLNVPQLIAAATATDQGLSTEPRRVLEIKAKKLDIITTMFITLHTRVEALAPHLEVSKHPRKLVIHQEGFSQDWAPALPSTNRKDHIGTLLVILNSTYTGGELEVTHGGRTEVVTGPYSWVAMYGDCLHQINPVTSGTRVSLIYDIYGTPLGHKMSVYDVFHELPDPTLVARNRLISAERGEFITNSVAQELTQFDTILITLQHLYPECEHSKASMLQGGDRILYDLLASPIIADSANDSVDTSPDSTNGYDRPSFEVNILNATVCYKYDTRSPGRNRLCMTPYSTEIVKKTLIKYDAAVTEYQKEVEVDHMKHLGHYKLYAPVRMTTLLHRTMREAEDLGEPTAGEAVYLVSCLQVCVKA